MAQGTAVASAETDSLVQVGPEDLRRMIEHAASVIGPLAVLAENDALDELDRIRLRQQVMIRNMGTALEGDLALGESFLHAYQRPIAGRLYQHLGTAPSEELSRSGMEQLATAWGKTPLQAKIIKDAGIGEAPYPGAAPLSVTVLTSRVPLVLQSEKRFQEFIPEVPFGLFYSEVKDLSKPGKIITYKSAQELSDDEVAELRENTDLFILDEADEALGRKRQKRVAELIKDRMAVFMSATDDFNEADEEEEFRRRVHSAWGVETIDKVTARESLDDGIINSARIILLASGKRVRIKSRRGSFTELDLRELRDDPDRDAMILSTVQWMAEEGIPGWTLTIGGGDETYTRSAQARRLAVAAGKIPIVDPNTGRSRTIRAEAVGSFRTTAENEAVLERFNAGELDVVFFSKLWSRGVDSSNVRYVFATNPTASITNRTQDFGRGARRKNEGDPDEEEDPTIYLEIVDEFGNNRRRPITFLHVVGEDDSAEIEQGKVYGRTKRPGSNIDTSGRKKEIFSRDRSRTRRGLDLDRVPDVLRGAIDALNGVILADITLVERKPPPKGWLPSSPLLEEFGFVAVSSLVNALRDYPGGEGDDDQPAYHVSGSGKGCLYFFNPEAIKWAREGGIASAATEQFVAYSDARRDLGSSTGGPMSWDLINRLVGLLGLEKHWMRLGVDKMNRMGWCLTKADYEKLKEYVDSEYTFYDPGRDVSTMDMSDALGHHRTRVRVWVQQYNKRADRDDLPASRHINFYPRRQRIGRDAFCLESEQAHYVMDSIGRHMPPGAVLVNELAERLDEPPEKMSELLARSPYRWHVKTKQVFNITNDIAWLEAEDAAQFVAWANSGSARRSTLGYLEDIADLSSEESSELDSVLFDLSNPKRLSTALRVSVFSALEDNGALDRLDETQRGVFEDLFKSGNHPLETIARRLIQQGKIQMPAKPLVTNMQRHLASELDHFLAGALNGR